MSRIPQVIALLALAALAACSGGKGSAPRNLDNACSIIDQRPGYLKAFKKTQSKWGVPVAVQMATIYQESKFISDARTPFRYTLGVIPAGRQSSAYGYAQALDATWKEYKRNQRRPGARRNKINDATDFMGWYMTETNRANGIALTDTRNLYLAYHDGNTGWRKGTYRKKPWLMKIARGLEDRAFMYNEQLIACGKI